MAVSDKYKQVIIIRQDLNMGVGKKVAQGCNPACHCGRRSPEKDS